MIKYMSPVHNRTEKMSKRRAKKNKCGWILTNKAATAMIREIESGATATILDRFAGHASFVS